MTSKPIVTTTKRPKPNQPRTMAEVPTPLFTLPLPSVCTIVLAATDAVCCHSTETSTNIAAIQINDRAICDTGREGNGLISRSEPVSSSSSCHPGNVASKIKQKKASIIATMLLVVSSVPLFGVLLHHSHQVWKNHSIFERRGQPNHVERILVQCNDFGQRCSIGVANK